MKNIDLAKAMAAYCVRNTSIENIHGGLVPITNTGDYSDVFVIDANDRKTAWNETSRISQDEMKAFMQTVVDRIHDVLTNIGKGDFDKDVLDYALKFTKNWDDPKPVNHKFP